MFHWMRCLFRRHEWRAVDVRYISYNVEIWACTRCGKLDVRRMEVIDAGS